MSVAGTLLHFGLKQVFDIGTKELFGWIEERFTDSSQKIAKAVFEANQRAWNVVGLALSEETFTGWLRKPIHDGDLKAASKQILAVIASTPNNLGLSSVELHNRAAVDLIGLRKRNGLSAAVMAASAESLKRFSDPAALAEELLQAAANSPDELSADAPNLAAVLRLAPDGRTGLFEAMCRHFFRAIVAKDEDLSRRLTHDQLCSLAAIVDTRTAGILDQLDVLFDALAKLEGKVDAGFVGVNEKLDSQAEKLSDIQRRLAEPRKPSVSYDTEDERVFLSKAREEFRRNPGRITANVWERLGDAMNAARMYSEASEAHEAAAKKAHAARDTATEAANHYAAYLDACEAGDWTRASARLSDAVKLDATRYRPFDDRRYDPVRILGGGKFGTVFLCLDQYDLDENHQPTQVAIKSLRVERLDPNLKNVFAEARTLKALGHKSIIGVIDQGFGNPDTQSHPYLVLEYFPGTTLDLHVAEFGPLSLIDFFIIARQVAEAVYAAHTRPRPVLHRDLKPSNIMVLKKPDGTWIVKVIDFGLAVQATVTREGKDIPPANQPTLDKSGTGTIKYAPPEQNGELSGVKVGTYSDVYSFGKTCLDVLFLTTAPKSWDWEKLPVDVRGSLQKLLEHCTSDALNHRFENFEPVLKALAELDPAERANRERLECEAAEQTRRAEEAERVRLAAAESARLAAEQRIREETERREVERKKREREEAELKRRADEEARKKTEEEAKAKDPFHHGHARFPGEKVTLKLPGDVPIAFAWCPPGSFKMGSEKGSSDEKPVHKVTLTKGFFMGIHQVTQTQWKAVMGTEPSRFKGSNLPVEKVSWDDCQEFCKKLKAHLNGRVMVRLPTEAEWEYACRAGTTSDYCSGNDEAALKKVGWYSGTSHSQTQPVGKLKKNSWGLFDVHGNVWEWCEDWYGPYKADEQIDPCQINKQSDEYRVLRGGSWYGIPGRCRAAYRCRYAPALRDGRCGFRVCFRLD